MSSNMNEELRSDDCPNCKKRGRHQFASVDEKLLMQLRKCSHVIRHNGKHKGGQQRVLSRLYEKGNMTQRTLQDELEIKSGSLSEILSKIEAKGYIERERNEEDKRQVDLKLTDSGRETLEIMNQEQEHMIEELFSGLDENEKEQLSMLLGKFMGSWKAKRKQDCPRRSHKRGHCQYEQDGQE